MKEPVTTMSVTRKNRDRIAAFGKAGESLDDALSRIMDVVEIVWVSDAAPPERWAGVKKYVDVGDERIWLMQDGSLVIPKAE